MLVLLVVLQGTHVNCSFYIVVAILSHCLLHCMCFVKVLFSSSLLVATLLHCTCFGEVLFLSSLLVATPLHCMCHGEVLLSLLLPCKWCIGG
jgi:hypothetical protein